MLKFCYKYVCFVFLFVFQLHEFEMEGKSTFTLFFTFALGV